MTLIIVPTPERNNGVPEGELATLDDVRAAQYHTAHSFPGGVPALARLMKMSVSTLDKKVSLTNHSHHLTNVEASIMMDVTGDYRIVEVMSARGNRVTICMDIDCGGSPLDKIGLFSKEGADVISEVCAAVADGEVSPNEMRGIEKAASEQIAALQGLVATVRAKQPKRRRAA